jgi:signal transduction histidine kinase
VKDIDKILIRPQPPQPKDPALEHIDALAGTPFQAFPGQDHRAHMTAHLNFMATNMARNAPMIMAALEKNCFEHISLMAQEQVEIEFRNELQQLQMMQQQMANPQMQQNPQMAQQMQMQMQMQVRMLTEKIESRKAVLIAEMMEEFMKEENKITSQFGNDPIAMLRARELDLQAQENERKKKADQERNNIDKMKTMMNQMTDQQKLDQNEELARLRANTSIEKTILSAQLKNTGQK